MDLFKKNEGRNLFDEFADEECVDFDAISADCLMQIILFDEIVYG